VTPTRRHGPVPVTEPGVVGLEAVVPGVGDTADGIIDRSGSSRISIRIMCM
jgi:hypothetical protein